jgi:hypothetical protein
MYECILVSLTLHAFLAGDKKPSDFEGLEKLRTGREGIELLLFDGRECLRMDFVNRSLHRAMELPLNLSVKLLRHETNSPLEKIRASPRDPALHMLNATKIHLLAADRIGLVCYCRR